MDWDENELPIISKLDLDTDAKSYHKCKVCGNKGAQMYYGAECCAPCKMFFRRNSRFDLSIHQCVFDGECNVTVNNRSACRYCRLKKCLSVGLQRDLIRSSFTHQHRPEQADSLPVVIPTLNLLRNDRSLLTDDQWSLLSNVINAYDEKSSILSINKNIALQLTYPTKMRFKMAKDDFENIVSLWYINVTPFLDKLPEFKSLLLNDQTTLVERNIKTVGNFSGTLILRETDIYHNLYYYSTAVADYGLRLINYSMKIIDQADINGLLMKLYLPLILFSTRSECLDPKFSIHNISNETNSLSNTIRLFEIQNIYIELLFKYMLYQFSYKETILRFFGLVKTCLNLINVAVGCDELQKHENMIETIIKQTEETLILHQENTE